MKLKSSKRFLFKLSQPLIRSAHSPIKNLKLSAFAKEASEKDSKGVIFIYYRNI